jgi:DNA-binding response OmpR family regulator
MTPTPQPAAVLVVEDDPNTLAGYVEILEAAGLQAAGIANGADALGLAIRIRPDIVVTDITLPGLDGLSLAEALRADGRTRGIPVIGLTAQWTPDVRGHATKAGISTLLLKPCMPDHLLAEIRRVLKHAVEAGRNGRNGHA